MLFHRGFIGGLSFLCRVNIKSEGVSYLAHPLSITISEFFFMRIIILYRHALSSRRTRKLVLGVLQVVRFAKNHNKKYKKISIYANFIAIKMFFCKKIFNNLQKRDFFRIFVGGFCEKYSSLVRIAIVHINFIEAIV